MSNSQFKSIKNDVVSNSYGAGWSIQSDKHSGVVVVRYDENSGPNKIAALSYVNKPQNHYSFVINPLIKSEKFSETAQQIVSNKLMPYLIQDAKSKEIILYPATGMEDHVEWMLQAFQKNAQNKDIAVCNTVVQIAEKKKVPGIIIRVLS